MEREIRVLVVDDNEGVRSFVCAALAAKGFLVLQSDCGSGALEILREDSVPVDVVLTDVVMPGMNGPDLARNLADLSPLLPVLYMTGFTDRNVSVHMELRSCISRSRSAISWPPSSA